MKKKIVLLMIPVCLTVVACNGDHANNHGVDSAQHYNAPSNIDTSKTTATTGDASTIDNGGSGGTKIDTPKKGKADSIKK